MQSSVFYGINYHCFSNEFKLHNTASAIATKNKIAKSYKKERLFYIIREDGSSIFELPYREEFIYHCLICLFNNEVDEKFRLLEFCENTLVFNIIPIYSKKDLALLKV